MLPFELTKDTPYLALSGELWSVFYEYFNRNWSCYKGFLLYWANISPTYLAVWVMNWVSISLALSRPYVHFDGLMQERHNSSASAMELHLSCTNPPIWQPCLLRHKSDLPPFPDEGGSTDTYCEVCKLECKTAKALATHVKSKSHKIRAAEKKDDNKEEKQEGTETQGWF